MGHFRHLGSIPYSSTNWIKPVKAGIEQRNSHKSSEQDMQPRVVTGLPTGRYTMRRSLYIMGLIDSPVCKRCGAEGRPQSTLCVNVKLWQHLYILIWVPFPWPLRMLEV